MPQYCKISYLDLSYCEISSVSLDNLTKKNWNELKTLKLIHNRRIHVDDFDKIVTIMSNHNLESLIWNLQI